MRILVINAGSTSTKLRVVERDGRVERSLDLHATGEPLTDQLDRFLAEVGHLDATGHRVVHGGAGFTGPVVVNDSVRRALDALNDLAPLHNPAALLGVDAARRVTPHVPTVACFDTAFHASLHEAATTYALPEAWVARGGIRRYGFHGLSCEWSVGRAAALLERPVATLRLVICHLGGGASVTAVAAGRSVDTTMGFTPTEGLVMATRPGDVDPGAIAWLAARGVPPGELVDGLERRSGLLALTGTTDMRRLWQARAAGERAATRALDVYLHRLRSKIAAMCAAIEGTDVLVFTGGVGENAGEVRAAVCERLGWLGISVDPDLNTSVEDDDADISRAGAPVRTLVIHAREELVIAAGCRAVLGDPA